MRYRYVSEGDVPAMANVQVFVWGDRLWAALNLALIAWALHRWGAVEVRTAPSEVFFLVLLGVVWLAWARAASPWLGLSLQDDAIAGRNPAALVALSGAELSVAITFAAGNLGEGPSYWNNVFSAALGTGGLFALWLLLEVSGRVSVSVAEERDLASGLRLGGFLVGMGLILGRAVAGDWHSVPGTLWDFCRDGWPALPLTLIAVMVERRLRPSRERPFVPWFPFGLLPALGYLAIAALWVGYLGAWEGMP